MFLNNESFTRLSQGVSRKDANCRELPVHFTGPLCLSHLSEPVGLGPICIIQVNLHEVIT